MGAILVPVIVVMVLLGIAGVLLKRLGPQGEQWREEVMAAPHMLERKTANTLEGKDRGGPEGDPPPPEGSRPRFADER